MPESSAAYRAPASGGAAPPPAASTRPLTIAIIGNPNTGKSTLFNALSGMQSRVGNYPGVTVEKKVGKVTWHGRSVTLVDLPGTYSLSPRTLDEMVAVDVLLGRQRDVGTLDAVICIVDASNLERNLYLFSQLRDMGLPIVLVLNMMDVAESRGVVIDVEGLSAQLGVPVVATQAHRRRGLEALAEVTLRAADSPPSPAPQVFPAPFTGEVEALAARLSSTIGPVPKYLVERMLLDRGGQVEQQYAAKVDFDLVDYLEQARQRLRNVGIRVPAVEASARYAWVRETLRGVVTQPEERRVTASDRMDRLLTHRVFGLLIFIGLMFLVFQAIYSWAEPLMGAVEAVQGAVAGWVAELMPPGALRSLLIDGVIAGVGGVLVFLPQIALLFFFIALFEDCGYMARAAFLMDKLMTRVGLSGKSFVPLMSSFACAIPGIMATRVIENRRDRMITMLVAPLMSCSARLPVYLLLIAAFIPATSYAGGWISLQGLVLFAMMSLGALVAIPVAWVLRKTIFRGETPPFVMELPSYKWPSLVIVAGRVYDRAKAFVIRAGTLIFATTIIIWAAGFFPGDHAPLYDVEQRIETLEGKEELAAGEQAELDELYASRNAISAQLMSESFLGRAGKAIEPVVRPLGWDWKIGVGVIASFPAREVIIATLGTVYSLGGEVDEESDSLRAALKQAEWPDGRPVFTIPVAVSIMVFFALCAQCAATLMVMRRETLSWVWPAFTFAYMTTLAYLGALLAYNIGSWLF